jgi:hypothetical protein
MAPARANFDIARSLSLAPAAGAQAPQTNINPSKEVHGAARRSPFEPPAAVFRLLSKTYLEVDMPSITSRTDTLACSCAALALWLAGSAAAPAVGASIGSAYTDYDAKKCVHKAGREVEDYGEWRCRGLDGVAVLVSAGDQRMIMSFGPHAAAEPAVSQTLQGFNDVYKARIEWRLARTAGGAAQPFAAIVRWNTALLDDSPGALEAPRPKTINGKVLVVTRLGRRGVCHVGYVDALANRDAATLARKIADEHARAFRCDTDKPLILGETGPGFSASNEAEKVER